MKLSDVTNRLTYIKLNRDKTPHQDVVRLMYEIGLLLNELDDAIAVLTDAENQIDNLTRDLNEAENRIADYEAGVYA